MMFISKIIITYKPPSSTCQKETYRVIHNQLVRCARMFFAQMDYDFQIERLEYYQGEADAEIYSDVIYVYRQIKHSRAYVPMAKIVEGCAELSSVFYNAKIEVEYPETLPLHCKPCCDLYSDSYNYVAPEFLK